MMFSVVYDGMVEDIRYTRKGAINDGYRVLLVGSSSEQTLGWVHPYWVRHVIEWTAQSSKDTSRPVRGFRTRRLATEQLLRMHGYWPWM